ncbi:hypothetical protein ABZU32_20410 [Sphaerisporangium sp. NPDC005288]
MAAIPPGQLPNTSASPLTGPRGTG